LLRAIDEARRPAGSAKVGEGRSSTEGDR